MRFLEGWNRFRNKEKYDIISLKDYYECTLLHYAVRQGHLSVLIYLVETFCEGKMHILKMRDKFGYSVLDYSIVYKRLYCFIYLFHKCKIKDLDQLANGLVESLCTGQDLNTVNETQIPANHPQRAAFKIAQVLLRDDETQKKLA